jgi:flavin reductase
MHTSLVAPRNTSPLVDHVILSKTDFRHAMSRLGAAVNIITTDGPAGRAGFTASAVCSVTDEPPTLLVCLNRSASVYQTFKGNGVLCVNVLGTGHQEISNLFGGKTPMDERFAAGQWSVGPSGSPLLEDASVSFDCRLSQIRSGHPRHPDLRSEVDNCQRRGAQPDLLQSPVSRAFNGLR